MTNLILIDTSAWICAFERKGHERVKHTVDTALVTDSLVIADPVIFELLAGARSQKQFIALRQDLNALKYVPITRTTWNLAADIHFKLRQQGILCPTMDILIASVAIENNVPLLHRDKHFEMMGEADLGLQLFLSSPNILKT